MPQAVAFTVFGVGVTWGTVAAVALSAASLAYSYSMAKKAKSASQDPAERKQIVRSSSAPINHIYGRVRSAGVLTFAQEQGGSQSDGEWIYLVLAAAGHQIHNIHDVRLNEEPLSEYDNYYEMATYPLGRTTVDTYLTSNCPDWTDDMIGKNFAWMRMALKFNQEKFPSGLPGITMLKDGYRVTDIRTGNLRWSDNPALCILHFLRARLKMEDEFLILDTFKEAANICDETVTTPDGNTEKRYTIGCEFDDSDTPASVLDRMLSSCGGEWIRVGGRIGLKVAAYYGPAFVEITEDEIIEGIEIQPEVDRSEAFNIVRGTFVDPEQNYTEVDYPEVRIPEWVAEDEEEIVMDMDLNYVQSGWQAQRLADIAVKRNRLGMIMKLPCNMRGFRATPGTMINLTLDTIGFNKTEFMVVDWEFSIDNGVVLVVRRDLPSFYDDAVGKPVVAPPLIDLPTGGIAAPRNPQFIARAVGDVVQGVITWTNSSFKLERTDVTVKELDGTIIQAAPIPWPGFEYPLNGKLAGTYDIELQSVGVNGSKSQIATMRVTIEAPDVPDVVNIKASNWSIHLTPAYNLKPVPFGTLFEFYVDETQQPTAPPSTRKPDEVASSWNQGGLTPNKYYYYWIRAVNSYGKSGWTQVTAKTTSEAGLVETLVEKLIGIEIYAPYIASGEGPNPAFLLDGRPEHGNGLIKGATIIGSAFKSDNYVADTAGFILDRTQAQFNSHISINAATVQGRLTAAEIYANKIVGDLTASGSFSFSPKIVSPALPYTDHTLLSITVNEEMPYEMTVRIDQQIRIKCTNPSGETGAVGEAWVRNPQGNVIERYISLMYDNYALDANATKVAIPAGTSFVVPANTKGTYTVGWNNGGIQSNLKFFGGPIGSREDSQYDMSVSIFRSGTIISGSQA